MPTDVGCPIRGKKSHCVGHILRRAKTPEGDAADELGNLGGRGFLKILKAFRLDDTWSHSIHPDLHG